MMIYIDILKVIFFALDLYFDSIKSVENCMYLYYSTIGTIIEFILIMHPDL